MSDVTRARKGDWVEVECKLLDPADRSTNLPPETAEKPLMMWVKGFVEGEAALGEETTIETMTGRKVTGKLSAINPGYTITYGDPIPELVHIGRDLRSRLAAYRAGEGAAAAGGAAPAGCGCSPGCCSPAEGGER